MVFILSLLITSASPSINSAFVLQEKIEVRVGKEKIIMSSDIDQLTEKLVIENPTVERSALRIQARDQLIDQALISEYLHRYEMQIGDRELKNAMLQSFGLKSEEDLRAYILSHSGDFSTFQNQFRWQMEKSRFYSIVQRQSTRTKDQAALLNYFNRNRTSLEKNQAVEIEECTIVSSDQAAAMEEARSYINNPKSFNQCLKKWGQGLSKKSPQKSLKFTSGSLPDFVEAKVFNLKVGQIAEFRFSGRIQLLKLISIDNLKPLTFEELKPKIEAKLDEEDIQNEVSRIISDLKANSFIKIIS